MIQTVRNTGIVRQLLANLNELSSRISSPQTSSETEADIRRVFSGHFSCNGVNVSIPSASPSTLTRASTTGTPSSNIAQVCVPNRSFVMRRNFSGQRPSSSSSPSLAPGQEGIDGAILQRLFQSKAIYIRPSRQIIIEHQV